MKENINRKQNVKTGKKILHQKRKHINIIAHTTTKKKTQCEYKCLPRIIADWTCSIFLMDGKALLPLIFVCVFIYLVTVYDCVL